MNSEKLSYAEHPRHKRAAAILIMGIATVSVLAGCTVQHGPEQPTSTTQEQCATRIESPASPVDLPEVALLKRYERETGVAPEMMKFITMPGSVTEAREQATALAGSLKTWSNSNASPMIIMEPTLDSGDNLDLNKLGDGAYDAAFDTYFCTLKESGITDKEMGTWVPLPEPNLPEWKGGVTDPELFARNITKIAGSIKKYFPKAPVSIMLDSTTYLPSPDPDWNNGSTSTAQLEKYVSIKPGLIDSFGFQGFTWTNEDAPNDYLNADAAIACARRLGVKNVWFNTGTYKKTHNPDDDKHPLIASNARRESILNGVLEQAKTVQAAGLHVDTINIFAQNTFDGSDGTADFTYTKPEEVALLKSFVAKANADEMPVTIFDAAE